MLFQVSASTSKGYMFDEYTKSSIE
jgi:hypothetical protein